MKLYLTFALITLNSLVFSQSKCVNQIDTLTQREVYFISDIFPEFIPSTDSLKSFIQQNLTYSKECVEGNVYVGFIVESTGELTSKRVVKGISRATDEHALRLIDKIPNWIPGTCDGKKVLFFYIISIRFQLIIN